MQKHSFDIFDLLGAVNRFSSFFVAFLNNYTFFSTSWVAVIGNGETSIYTIALLRIGVSFATIYLMYTMKLKFLVYILSFRLIAHKRVVPLLLLFFFCSFRFRA